MKYTIISNCCGGADVYVRCGTQYSNPFVWSEIFEDDLIKLLKHFDKIDFNNYDIERKNITIFGINVDHTFTVWFPHYKYDASCLVPTKKGFDTCYYRNYEYVLQKYDDRVKRMNNEYTPFFLIFAYKDKIKNETQCQYIQTLLENSKYESILFSPYKLNGSVKNKVIIEKSMMLNPAPTPGVYVEKYNLASKFMRLI